MISQIMFWLLSLVYESRFSWAFHINSLPESLKDVSLKHPTELIDMIIAFTNNHRLKEFRNEVAISELEGKTMNMGIIFDNIVKKK